MTATRAILQTLTGQEPQPQLAVVASTLLIAPLFAPLRRRTQGFIDRRFYRRKCDASKTLKGISAKLRDETDLDALNDELIEVVRETMQPAHVGLWLRSDSSEKAVGGSRAAGARPSTLSRRPFRLPYHPPQKPLRLVRRANTSCMSSKTSPSTSPPEPNGGNQPLSSTTSGGACKRAAASTSSATPNAMP